MKEKILLSIPTPCLEKWEEFSLVKDGAFCETCCKTIIDFTKMSDDEVVQFFSNEPSNTCGRFRQSQIREYKKSITHLETGFPLLKAGILCLIMLLLNEVSQAQTLPSKAQSEFVQEGNQSVSAKTINQHDFVIKGEVKDENNQSMPGVNVVLKGKEVGTSTDRYGKFEFPQKLEEGDILVFEFVGYKSKEFVVTNIGVADVSIPMEPDMVLLDEVFVLGEVRVSDQSSHFSLRELWINFKSMF